MTIGRTAGQNAVEVEWDCLVCVANVDFVDEERIHLLGHFIHHFLFYPVFGVAVCVPRYSRKSMSFGAENAISICAGSGPICP